jgi:hypothetical protein
MPLNDKSSFKITIADVPSATQNSDALLDYLVNALGLSTSRGSHLIARHLLKLFILASDKKNGFIDSGIQELQVIDSGLKASDIVSWLKAQEAGISTSQLYNNYLNSFARAGLIVKRRHSAYGLKADSLYSTLKETELNVKKEFDKILEHARQLDALLKPSH